MKLLLDNFLTPRELSLEEKGAYSAAFWDISGEKDNKMLIYKGLHTFFVEQNFSETVVAKYFDTYWKWYVQCSWDGMLSIPADEVLVWLPKQLTTAFMLKISVIDSILYYLYRHLISENEQKSYFVKLQKAIVEEKMPLNCVVSGVRMTLKEAVETLSKKTLSGLELADFYAKVQAQLFPSGSELVYVSDFEKQDLVNLFSTFIKFMVSTSEIKPAIQNYLDIIEGSDVDTSKPPEQVRLELLANYVAANENKGLKEKNFETATVEPPAPPAPPSPTETMSHADIRAMIEARFSQDKDGQFVNIDGVLSLLDSLATEMDDDRIRELYFFDEASGGFKWNDALLT